jgi:hypothetical protein
VVPCYFPGLRMCIRTLPLRVKLRLERLFAVDVLYTHGGNCNSEWKLQAVLLFGISLNELNSLACSCLACYISCPCLK